MLNKIPSLVVTSLFYLISLSSHAQLFSEEPAFLPVDQAFVFDYYQQGDKLTLSFQIAPDYYLYKKQFKTVTKGVVLSAPTYPPSEQIEDEFFGVSEVFFQRVEINYDIHSAEQDGVVKLQYQGCATAGLCYPPTVKVIYLNEVISAQTSDEGITTEAAGARDNAGVSSQFELADALSRGDNLPYTLLLFVLLGVGLAFTPCVFPMYPILSSIVLGQGKSLSVSHAFRLSFIYVQGMAITYSLLGLVVAAAGVKFQAALQHPAILTVMIALFVVLAMAMFGSYNLQLPASWQAWLANLSNQQKGGKGLGVFIMGVISGLVASPCTTAPLTGILLYIAQTGDQLLGFTALYALSMGMGIPLILFAVSGGKLLPRAGNWMNVVKVTFGFMLLAVALFFVERLVIHYWTDLAWALLGMSLFSYYWVMNQGTPQSLAKGIRVMLIFTGLFSAAIYAYHHLPLHPTSQGAMATKVSHGASFMRVKDLSDFQQKLAQANAQGKSVMVDLYADWCVACKEFEKFVFSDAQVQSALKDTVLMQIDLTDNTKENLAFQDHFDILGLPTILFFSNSGEELAKARVTGFMPADKFATHVNTNLAR